MESRQKAQAMILAGEVRVTGQRADKAGTMIPHDAAIEITRRLLALRRPRRTKTRRRARDSASIPRAGFASTPAAPPAASPIACCNMAPRASMPWTSPPASSPGSCARTPAWSRSRQTRAISTPKRSAERPSLVTVDLSFISVAKVLPRLVAAAAPGAEFLILVKPQFELERERHRPGRNRARPATARARHRTRACGGRLRRASQVHGVKPSRLTGRRRQPGVFPARHAPRAEFRAAGKVAGVECACLRCSR